MALDRHLVAPEQLRTTMHATSGSTAALRAEDRSLWARLLRNGVRPLFLAGDLAACAVAWLLAPTEPRVSVVFTLLLVALFAHGGLYRSQLALSLLDDLPRLAGRWILTVALVMVGTQLTLNRLINLQWTALTLGALVVVRAVSYGVVRFLRAKGAVSHATLILGTGRTGRDLAQLVKHHPESGLHVIGYLDNSVRGTVPLDAPLLGRPQDLPQILTAMRPRALIVAHGRVGEGELVRLVRACHRHRCEVFVVPRLYEVQHVGDEMDFIGDMPLGRLRRAAYRTGAWQLKRLFDVVFAGLAIVLLAPVLLICALAVYCEGGPGVIFRQQRVGCDGRLFELMKFRSLRPLDESESQTQWNIAHDDRLGPVGRFLRVSSIDELPQLFNILRGDMSFVGPRPERPHFVEQFDQLYRGYSARHRVPSGLTGWAQVHGLRGDTSIDARARFDNFYIENWSLWLDLKILLRTVVSVFKAPGA
jgi:exopolysaccharide biosynthesis polyprenyl glycosylphosphotransferase